VGAALDAEQAEREPSADQRVVVNELAVRIAVQMRKNRKHRVRPTDRQQKNIRSNVDLNLQLSIPGYAKPKNGVRK
jgi:hypothetical protein